jgi:hypothetical protein
MGQPLFAPPNVKGWPGGRDWLNTSTLLERDNFAAALSSGSLWTGPPPRTAVTFTNRVVSSGSAPAAFDTRKFDVAQRPDELIRDLVDIHLPGGVTPQIQAKLTGFLSTGLAPGQRIREVVHAMMTMPEYQLA